MLGVRGVKGPRQGQSGYDWPAPTSGGDLTMRLLDKGAELASSPSGSLLNTSLV